MNLRTFTQNGNGFFLHRPSEIAQFSLSARAVIHPTCDIVVKDGSRPPLPSSTNQAPASEPVVNGTNTIDTEPDAVSPQERVLTECHNSEANERTVDSSRLDMSTVASVHNESSLAVGDVTVDSVQVHISEATASQVVCAPVLVSTMWDKSTMHSLKNDAVFSLTAAEVVVSK